MLTKVFIGLPVHPVCLPSCISATKLPILFVVWPDFTQNENVEFKDFAKAEFKCRSGSAAPQGAQDPRSGHNTNL